MKNENKNKILLYISFIVVLLLILLRFGISYLKRLPGRTSPPWRCPPPSARRRRRLWRR